MLIILTIFITLFSTNFLYAQEPIIGGNPNGYYEAGIPYLINFGPKDYNTHPKCFEIIQDKRGIMYICNGDGVLEYDGNSWELIPVPSSALSISISSSGTIFVGSIGDFGYFDPDEQGNLVFKSLLQKVPKEYQNFGSIYKTIATSHGIYFQSSKYLFRWTENKIHVWIPQTTFHYIYENNDMIYVDQSGLELKKLDGDEIVPINHGLFFSDKQIVDICEYNEKSIMIVTRKHGLFLYDNSEVVSFSSEADAFLESNLPYNIAKIQNNYFAITTSHGGVVIINEKGSVIQIIDKSSGLQSNDVYFIFPDNQGAFWVSLSYGLSRIEAPSPISIYFEPEVHGSYIYAIQKHKENLFIAARNGVFYIDKRAYFDLYPGINNIIKGSLFKRVEGIGSAVWSLLSIDNSLLATNKNGLYEIRENKVSKIDSKWKSPLYLHRSKLDKNRVYLGLISGVASVYFNNGEWIDEGKIEGITESVHKICEDTDGILWLSTPFQSVLKIEINNDEKKSEVSRFNQEHSLPPGFIDIVNIKQQTVFATQNGLRQFDSSSNSFIPCSLLGDYYADTLITIARIVEDATGHVWIRSTKGSSDETRMGVLQNDKTYQWQKEPFLRMSDIGNKWNTLYHEKNGVTWFGGYGGIARYDPTKIKNYNMDYAALIRKVIVNGDSIIFGGQSAYQSENSSAYNLSFENNEVRMIYAATSYDESSENLYQYRLEGFDKDWSGWTKENKKDYTNLFEGDYLFRVRAKNVYQHPSTESKFAFSISPPWYRTVSAYIIYFLIILSFLFGIWRLEVRRIRKRNEIKMKLFKAEKLKEIDQIKSQFFANISHEFRTPLTLILGPLEDKLSQESNSKEKTLLNRMHNNASRLLRLINQLLDLSRLESGKMELDTKPGNLISFIKGIVMSFASLADQKKIQIEFDVNKNLSANKSVNVLFDSDKIEKIFSNLLSNAFKFTSPKGKIAVNIELLNQNSSDSQDFIILKCSISDTGIGLSTDTLPYIFDRFYQNDSSKSKAGSGIGLALTKELVELHNGTIEVESKENQGTRMTVTLKLEKSQLPVEYVESEISDNNFLPENTNLVESSSTAENSYPNNQENQTIVLLVEDHYDVRSYIHEHLHSDYKVVEADNGKAGIDIALDIIPDLIISDVMMPGLDGYQLCRTLKSNEKTSHIPIILLTAKAGEQSKLTGLEIGADDYLTKPFNAKELQARVKNLIEQRQKLQERFQREALLQPQDLKVTSIEQTFIKNMMSIIETNIANEQLDVEYLSEQLNMSRRQLLRKIQALSGESPSDFIRKIRLQTAKKLLEQKAATVSEIAYQVGFNNLSYFSKVFKAEYGKAPSEF